MEKIVVMGTGTMAAGIGAGFIQAGFEVVFLGRTLVKAELSLAAAQTLAAGLAAGTSIGDAAPTAGGSAGLIDTWNDWLGVVWVIETVA